MPNQESLIDGHGRKINYLRLSVTDRCNFRCVYCMNEDIQFMPRQRLLSLEEMHYIAQAFAELGVTKIRLTGGEPLVRNDAIKLAQDLASIERIKTLAITTNGSKLVRYAKDLKQAGVSRLNISLDTLDEKRFQEITRIGSLQKVLDGIAAAQDAGFEHTKINAVIMKGQNDHEVDGLVDFALQNDLDISFIEEMPVGVLSERDRLESFCSSEDIKGIIQQSKSLIPSVESSGGPARYFTVPGYNSRIGFISPHSNNFCSSCNRLRLTAEGRLLLCLGNEDSVDLRGLIRRYPGDMQRLKAAIVAAVQHKPKEHVFDHSETHILRFMNMTGG